MNKYLNRRYVKGLKGYKTYINHNGVFKEFKLNILSRKLIDSDKLFYLLSDLPIDIQHKYEDIAISEEDLELGKKERVNQNKQFVIDDNGTKIFINDDTPLLPIVGNFLPSDGVNAYRVAEELGHLVLIPILICSNCHWSDLFTGNTKYGNNVFCLVSDLDQTRINDYLDEIISLKDAMAFLHNQESKERQK